MIADKIFFDVYYNEKYIMTVLAESRYEAIQKCTVHIDDGDIKKYKAIKKKG